MTTEVYILRCKNIGITINELDYMNICDALDLIYTYIDEMNELNDRQHEGKAKKANQEMFNKF